MTRIGLALALASILVLPGCGTMFMRYAVPGEFIAAPPDGKVLINVHRPSGYEGGDWFGVFDGTALMGGTKGRQWFQYVCDPGEHTFIGRKDEFWASISVVHARDLLPDRVYDLVVDVGWGFFSSNIALSPLKNPDKRRPQLMTWELSERQTVIQRDGSVADFEVRFAEENMEASRDFVEGGKRERLQLLEPADHR